MRALPIIVFGLGFLIGSSSCPAQQSPLATTSGQSWISNQKASMPSIPGAEWASSEIPTPERVSITLPGRTGPEDGPGKPGPSSAISPPVDTFSRFETFPEPSVIDPVSLNLTKSWAAGTWLLNLTWFGSAGPFTVTTSPTPSFQSLVTTLAQDTGATSLGKTADTTRTLENFVVSDPSTVNPASQTVGYVPYPAPTTPSWTSQDYWWGSTITISADYLDLIPKADTFHIFNRPVRAMDTPPPTSGGNGFATDATFTIPNDARTSYVQLEAHGLSSPYPGPSLKLYAKNIAIGTITSMTWATCTSPSKGNVWVAGGGSIHEVDIFKETPVDTPIISGLTRPLISRATNDGRIIFVDGILGHPEIFQINVCTGAVTHYAYTTDQPPYSAFTRDILPVGITVDPNPGYPYCYIADANMGKVVRIREANVQAITDNWGNKNPAWIFPDPCGMDMGFEHYVRVGNVVHNTPNPDTYQYGVITGSSTTYMYSASISPKCIEVDRDISDATTSNVWMYAEPTCEAFNYNGIEGVTGTPVLYHGARVFTGTGGKLELTPDWNYYFSRHYPQRIILNNAGQSVAYPSPYQSLDSILQLKVFGYPGVRVQLRIIDPPDLSAYAQDGGWCGYTGFPTCTPGPQPPYEGNDNLGMTGYGLGTNPTGSDASTTPLKVLPDGSGVAYCYLKVPPNVSGNNFQVEMTKCNRQQTPLSQRISDLSPIYTTWKRVFVERDKMFRKGGLLFEDFDTGTCSPNCNKIKVYDWSNVADQDSIVVFDETSTYEKADREVVTVVGAPVPGPPNSGYMTATLSANLTKNYFATSNDGLSPPKPNFTNGHSGGVGVTSGCDASTNQINASNSCFYDADMRDFQQPFGDAFVEFIGQASGMGAVPYISNSVATFYVDTSGGGNTEPGKTMRRNFQYLWFQNKDTNNYLHLLGVRGPDFPASGVVGFSRRWALYTFIHDETILQYQPNASLRAKFERTVNDHEHGHQFRVNDCTGQHDTRPAWCNDPPNTSCSDQPCLMEADAGGPIYSMDDINRFCKEDLLLDSSCGDGSSAIRRTGDLVKTE